ncbi:MAG: penicillin-binding transpeptidase domain-containing protein [Candidatus Paceibacterota bacterium]|jgi:penicillin-binding protein 2
MAKNKEIYLEEAILDDFAKDLDLIELPLSEKAFKLVKVLILFAVLAAVGEILFLGVIKGKFYQNRALLNAAEKTTLLAERGLIFDRFGKPLVSNSSTFRLNLKISNFIKDKNEEERTIKTLKEVLGFTTADVEDFLKKIKEVDLETQNSIVVKEITPAQALTLKNLNLDSLEVEEGFKRIYNEPETFSHLIGYTTFTSAKDLEKDSSLSFNDLVGRSGLEAYYNNELKGENGIILSYRNTKGEIIEKKQLNNPISGENLNLTIDSEFQSYFYNRMQEGLRSLGRDAGIGIAINPQNGEVLSLISIPSFNNNKITQEALTNPSKPFFDRAISGAYSPGSTIKPLVAIAALKEKIISPLKEILSTGYIEVPNPYYPDKPSRFLDWKPNGWVNFYSAIARSCNIYFYEVGGGFEDQKGLGIEKLKSYWEKFGLGEKTGIDLPGEVTGFLPDASTKKGGDKIWRVGDTYNVSIGQGDLLLTPIQLINYIALIADNGKNYRPFVDKNMGVKPLKDLSDLLPEIKEVQKGMIDAVIKPYGTAYSLNDLPVSVAAKTGSAQTQNNTVTNALFVGYAPVENPQIAILVLVENAREGSLNTLPIAKDVLLWYYNKRIAH